jgi:hypothetical protein
MLPVGSLPVKVITKVRRWVTLKDASADACLRSANQQDLKEQNHDDCKSIHFEF